ncbi:MAG: helix-hairpin-helix domain-containing protein, partial [Planctomycetota bacterium]
MINAELVRAFEQIADLLEIDGADTFRISSYRRAARTLEDLSEDVATVAAEQRLTELSGIGKGTAERIQQFLTTGRIPLLDELEAKFPPGLPKLLEIPGMGPKKVGLVYRELKVGHLDDLKKVVASGALAQLPGMGEASVKKIADGIAFLESSAGRTPLGIALPVAEELVRRVAEFPGVRNVAIGGSLRRGAETVGDVDLLCDADDGAAVVRQFIGLEGVRRVLASGGTKGSVTVDAGGGRELQIDLRVVESDSFGAALQYFTGSKAHNGRLRERAVARKW